MSSDIPETPLAPDATPTGILLIDKQRGFTSMDVCAIIRSRFRRAGPHIPKRLKVGHAGTLDPLATGLLVVLVGKATRLCETFMASTKTYEAAIDLSHTSTTDDAEGVLTPVAPTTIPTLDNLQRVAAASFTGVIMQRPPAFSAISVGGRRAYDLARANKPLDLAERPVRIDSFTVTGYHWPIAHATITCGKGTYIRSLARDLGASLGVGGMLSHLRRTASGHFAISQACTLDALPQTLAQANLLPIPPTEGQQGELSDRISVLPPRQ